ncbi:hypothetical protein F5Y16DRAFT_386598 [Xylariaceae sp. FL0255]|nr:hypothetical protein F5Y16DRAFT_386598 [Xylariaceae sp. FL0255]
MFKRKFAFSRLPTGEDDPSPTLSSTKRICIFGSIVALLITITLFILAFSSSIFPQSSAKWSSCGDSKQTAEERGCSFDLISFAWQTPECYDAELVTEFASWNWSFYTDDQLTIPVRQDLAIQGELTDLYVSWHYHTVHCTFIWRQMHRAYEKGWIDTHLRNYNHTMHCQNSFLIDDEEAAKMITMARLIYPECTRPGQKYM